MGLFSFLGSILESLYGDDKEKSEEKLQEEKEDENKDGSGDYLPEYDDGEWKGPVIWH